MNAEASDIKLYYFLHPESQSAWTRRLVQEEFERLQLDPLVEIVDEKTYMQACAAWGCEP